MDTFAMKHFLLILFGSISLLSNAVAEQLNLRYQAVMHITNQHSISILNEPKHVMGLVQFHGLAIFTDNEVVDHRYEGGFEVTPTDTRFHGYALWRFADGAELRATYQGAAAAAGDGIEFDAKFLTFTGTDRFAGVTGEGMFTGRRYDRLNAGGNTYAVGELNLTLP